MVRPYGAEAKPALLTFDVTPGGTDMSSWSMMDEWSIPYLMDAYRQEAEEILCQKETILA